jgi:DNA-binding response OmpR family regulator
VRYTAPEIFHPEFTVLKVASMDSAATPLKILIVEDEVPLLDALVKIFTRFGHDVRGVGDGKAMDAALADYAVDIVVLDLNLPGEDGVQISRRLRQSSSCGIIMMTGRGRLDEKLDGYQCGADLYFVKPVDPEELHAAIVSLGRRLLPVSPPGWSFDAIRSNIITPRNISVPLTAQQTIVLGLLTARIGESVPRAEILSALGHTEDEYANQRLETLVSRLRSRVKAADPESELPVRARSNLGYSFMADVEM